jgi:hypothetical protein
MHPADAANEYLILAATDLGAAIRFAHEYEDGAPDAAFDAYLRFIELHEPAVAA